MKDIWIWVVTITICVFGALTILGGGYICHLDKITFTSAGYEQLTVPGHNSMAWQKVKP